MVAFGTHRYAVLFYSLLLALGAAPLLAVLGASADVLQILLAFSLLVALLDVPQRSWRIILISLVAVMVLFRAAPSSMVGAQVQPGALAACSGVALLAAASAIRFAMRPGAITPEKIYAALSAYLLAGVFFGVLYWAVDIAWPGSFGDLGAGDPAEFSLSTAIYYSFVTLATLGYGDIVPKTTVARGVAVFEAVGGQLYVAVMIASLVGRQGPLAPTSRS